MSVWGRRRKQGTHGIEVVREKFVVADQRLVPASLYPLSLPLLSLSSPGKGGAAGSWQTVLEQHAPQCCVHTRAMGAGDMVLCSWVRLFSLSPFLICTMSTVPLPGYPVLRERSATSLLGIESEGGS